jgi:hypothetical protein
VLHSITVLVNFIFLSAALWLGIYVVSRSPRSAVAWLTGLTLWSGAGIFLNTLLAIIPPPYYYDSPGWIIFLIPFWPSKIFESGWMSWLQGWLFVPTAAFWLHATTLMKPGGMNRVRWGIVIVGYIAAVSGILLMSYTTSIVAYVSGHPLFLNTLKPGSLYYLFMTLLLFFTGISIYNLLDSTRNAQTKIARSQFVLLAIATFIAILTAPVSIGSAIFEASVPRVVLSSFLGSAVILIGYGVAVYSALVEGRTIRRDFAFSAISITIVVMLYFIAAMISVEVFGADSAAYLFVLLFAICTHSFIDISRRKFDMTLNKQDYLVLRDNIKLMVDQINGSGLEDFMSYSLDHICTLVRATYGVLLIFDGELLGNMVTYNWQSGFGNLTPNNLKADDVIHLDSETLPAPYNKAALLLPLYAENEQFGTILLGRPINGIRYSQTDVDKLLYPCDQIAEAIYRSRQELECFQKVAGFSSGIEPKSPSKNNLVTVKRVEQALKHISDYAYLGDSGLVNLNLVHQNLSEDRVTYVDRGKALYGILIEAVEKLKPDDGEPSFPAAREWYPYLILHGAYFEDKLNRDIMSQLYISEGTFNRTRRSAIRSVTRMLEEMEAALN